MTLFRRSLLLLVLIPFAAFAQQGWHDMQGNPVPDSDAAKSRGGFNAMLVITPDQDWQEKWNTPPETVPYFSEAREVGKGGELFILTFLSNPAIDASRNTDVACDFKVTRPDATTSVDEIDLPCFKVALPGDPRNVFLSAASMKYTEEPGDLRGTWRVNVVVKDRLREIELPLEASFVVGE